MIRGQVSSFDQARRRKSGSPRARWKNVADEFAGDVWPELNPSFRIRPGETIFTIGSCFARNIERHLEAVGCRVPMMDFRLPPEEWSGGANGAMNKFHPPAFRQCLEWTAAIFDRDGRVAWTDCEALAFDWGDGRFFDMDMGTTAPVSRERFIERRQHIYDIFSAAFSADCLMMTPGLIEAWRDVTTGLYVHEPPTQKPMVAQRSRWEFEVLAYEQCLADLLAAIDLVRARNPGVKVLVTTSPVPLAATFSGQDIRIANAYSKSVLRAVCGAVTFQRPLVDYFPSYESATLSFPVRVWEPDRIHVSSGFVGKIVAHMLDHYLEGAEEAGRAHQTARTHLMNRSYAEAEAAAREALAARPEHLEAQVVLAEALLCQDRCAEAESEFRALAERQPDRAELWVGVARAVSRLDPARAAEAIAHVETAAALPSVNLSHFRAVGELIRRRAAPETAERLSRRAVELFPLHVEAYQPLVNVLLDQGRAGEAIEVLRRAVGLRRAPAQMRVQLAGLLADAGESGEAQQHLRSVLSLEPQNGPASELLRRLTSPAEATAAAASPALAAPPVRRKPGFWAALARLARS
jgi:tetratricopeptide (TPR) repeat protein